MIAEKWKLTNSIINTLAYHHSPETVDEEIQNLVVIVSAGNIYANHFEIGSAGDRNMEPSESSNIIGLSGLNWEDIISLEGKVQEEINKAQVFLKVGRGS